MPHDRLSVRALHQPYADKIESFLAGLKRAPGGPCDVQIRTIGPARTFVAGGHDWLNRTTLTGNGTADELDKIVPHFAAHRRRCHVEWNPGNCYRDQTWNDDTGRDLLARGFRPGGFRCVWAARPAGLPVAPAPPAEVRDFLPGELDEFVGVLADMEARTAVQRATTHLDVVHGEGDDRWHHDVASLDGLPCGTATRFAGDGFAYFEGGQTLEPYRGRGLHGAMIQRRLADRPGGRVRGRLHRHRRRRPERPQPRAGGPEFGLQLRHARLRPDGRHRLTLRLPPAGVTLGRHPRTTPAGVKETPPP